MKFEQVENKIEQYFANVSDQEILNLFIKAGYKFEKKMSNESLYFVLLRKKEKLFSSFLLFGCTTFVHVAHTIAYILR